LGEAISKEVISELEAALRETDLKQETIDSIIRSLKLRHRRWLAVRWAAVIVSIAALCTVFYLGIVVGRNRSTVWPVANSGPMVTQETPSLPEVKMPPVLVPDILGIPSEPSDFMKTFSVETAQEPKTEERVEEIIEDESVSVAPKSIAKELILSKEATPHLWCKSRRPLLYMPWN